MASFDELDELAEWLKNAPESPKKEKLNENLIREEAAIKSYAKFFDSLIFAGFKFDI